MTAESAADAARLGQLGGVDRALLGQTGVEHVHRVPLAEREQVLSTTSGIDDVDVHEAAVVQGHERNGGREGAAGVETLVHGVAALLEGQQADVGVLDGEQFQDTAAQQVVRDGRLAAPDGSHGRNSSEIDNRIYCQNRGVG